MPRHFLTYLMLACAWVLWMKQQQLAPNVEPKTYTALQGFESATICQTEMKRGADAFRPATHPKPQQPEPSVLTPAELERALELERKEPRSALRNFRYTDRLLCLPDTVDPRLPKR